MQAHVVSNGVVINTIEVEDLSFPVDEELLLIAGDVGGIGWTWDGVRLAPPVMPEEPVPVPALVTRFQARMALRNAGLFDQATALMADPATPITVVEAWESAQEFRRDSPNVQSMAVALGLDDQALDELFIAAAVIQA